MAHYNGKENGWQLALRLAYLFSTSPHTPYCFCHAIPSYSLILFHNTFYADPSLIFSSSSSPYFICVSFHGSSRFHLLSSPHHFLFLPPGGMKEQDLMCIKLHGVNRIGLKKIIDFIYTAKLSLNMENLQDTLEAASFLQILPVLDFCKVFLISGVRQWENSHADLHFLGRKTVKPSPCFRLNCVLT